MLVINDAPVDVAPILGAGWVQDMAHFIKTGECPLGLNKAKRRYFRL